MTTDVHVPHPTISKTSYPSSWITLANKAAEIWAELAWGPSFSSGHLRLPMLTPTRPLPGHPRPHQRELGLSLLFKRDYAGKITNQILAMMINKQGQEIHLVTNYQFAQFSLFGEIQNDLGLEPQRVHIWMNVDANANTIRMGYGPELFEENVEVQVFPEPGTISG